MTTQLVDQVKAALVAASTAAPPLTFTRYASAEATHRGHVETVSWASWLQRRAAAATLPWSSAGELAQRMARIRDELEGEAAAAEWTRAVKAAKISLPVEVGASLTDGRRTDAAVEQVTWLFIDVDGVEDVEGVRRIHRLLDEAGVNHLVIESPTSRMKQADGTAKGWRVHLYVQLAPVVLPAAASVPRREVKEWWRRLFAVAASALTRAVGLTWDASVDDLSQPCFVAHVPLGSDARRMQRRADGAALDVEAFVAALGQPVPRPAPPQQDRAAQAAPRAQERVGAAARPAEPSPPADAPAAPAEASPAKLGPTPGQTTGSLIMLAARHLGLLEDSAGRTLCLDRARAMWAVRCPWAANHASDPRQALGNLDSSTVLFDAAEGEDGGFQCKHHGSGNPGECSKASAADVLRWARKRGAPLPDRPGWGGVVAERADAAAEPAAQDGGEAAAPATPAAQPNGPRRRDLRPRIVVRRDDPEAMRDAAIAALRGRADIFQRDGQLVDLGAEGPRPIPAEHLAVVLASAARWVTLSRTEDGDLVEKPAEVPPKVVGTILKAPPSAWLGIKHLRAVVKHPPLLPDGRLITTAGYDAESRLLYLPDTSFNVPARPTREDAIAAKDRLLRHIRNTAFCDERGPSVWLAFNLTLAARTAFPTAPMFGFDAAVAAAGKTSLVKIGYALVHGELPQLGAPVVDDDKETEKRLPVWALMPLVCFDNLKHSLASPVLDGAITAGRQTVRLLSFNQGLPVDLTSTTWAFTGNNVSVGDDAASRCIIARIKEPVNRRYDFAVDDVAYYRAHRPQAVADALTILRAFVVAGSPQREDAPYSRFVEWSRLVRQALLWLGLPDPCGGEVVDANLEARAAAMRAIGEWRRGLVDEAERKSLGAQASALPFHASDIDTSPIKARSEDDEAFRRRRAVVDALSAIYGRKVDSAVRAGFALGKLKDARLPLTVGDGFVRFCVEKPSPTAKTAYRLEFEAA